MPSPFAHIEQIRAALTPEQRAHFDSLPPPPPNFHGTGALPLTPQHLFRSDITRSLLSDPDVLRVLHNGIPEAVPDLSEGKIGGVYDQDGEGACVAYSEGGLCSLDEALNGRAWVWLDAENLYRRNGGTGANGVDTNQTLGDIQAHGINRRDGQGIVKIASYSFVPKQSGLFKDTIMAALAAGKPVVLATLLPQNFGWDSSGSPTQAYHQIVVVGGDDNWAIILNSWGSAWGNGGKGRLPWSYLDPNRWDVYSYRVDPAGNVPPPPPPPPAGRTLSGVVTGSNVKVIAVGDSLQVSEPNFIGVLTVSQISGDDNLPPPPPPPPPDRLTVHIYQRRFGSTLGLWIWTTDQNNHPVLGTVNLLAGSTSFGSRPASAIPATWQVPVAPGTILSVLFTAQDGRQASANAAAS